MQIDELRSGGNVTQRDEVRSRHALTGVQGMTDWIGCRNSTENLIALCDAMISSIVLLLRQENLNRRLLNNCSIDHHNELRGHKGLYHALSPRTPDVVDEHLAKLQRLYLIGHC